MSKADLVHIFISLFIQGIACYWVGYFVGKEQTMIVITSMTELPHSCMDCPFQKNQKTLFCRAARNHKRGWKNIPAAFGFYITDDAFTDGQTPWNSRAKWCPLKEVKGADDD